MNRTQASLLLAEYGVLDAGRLIAHKTTKAYEIWVWENGITKQMGKRKFAWIPDYRLANRGEAKQAVAAYYFALDNHMEIAGEFDDDMCASLYAAQGIVIAGIVAWRSIRRAGLRAVQ